LRRHSFVFNQARHDYPIYSTGEVTIENRVVAAKITIPTDAIVEKFVALKIPAVKSIAYVDAILQALI
jgi:hypothetical protein